jgi:ssDNA-binding replication factor A large subunit
MTVLDDSGECGMEMRVTLWGEFYCDIDIHPGDIIALRGAKLAHFFGRSLNLSDYHSEIFQIETLAGQTDKRIFELFEWIEIKKGKLGVEPLKIY